MPHFVTWIIQLCSTHSNITTATVTLVLSYPVFVISKATHGFLRLRGDFIKHRWIASRYVAKLKELDRITRFVKHPTRLVLGGIHGILLAVTLSFTMLVVVHVDAISKHPHPQRVAIILTATCYLLAFMAVLYGSWSRRVGDYDKAFHELDQKIVNIRSQLETNGIDVAILENKNEISYDVVIKEVHKIRQRDKESDGHKKQVEAIRS